MKPLSVFLVLCIVACLGPHAWAAADKAPPGQPAAAAGDAKAPGAEPAETPAPAEKPKPAPTTEAGARLEKQIAAVEGKLEALEKQAIDLQMNISKAVMKATEALGSKPKFKLEQSGERKPTPEMRELQKILRACVQQLQALDARWSDLMGAVRTLQRDRAAAELKDRLDSLEAKIQTQHRVNLLRIGDLQGQAADYKLAISSYNAALGTVPESDQQERTNIKYRIAGANENAGNVRQALTMYKELYDAMPAAHRDLNLMLRMARLYERDADYKSALDMYQEVKKSLTGGQTVGGLDIAIIRCESKLGGKGR
jgi:tetratricopeptide (TPR) repeat protein